MELLLARASVDRCLHVLMVVDCVDVVTTPKQCFYEVVAALLQFLLSVDIIDMVFTANRLRDTLFILKEKNWR